MFLLVVWHEGQSRTLQLSGTGVLSLVQRLIKQGAHVDLLTPSPARARFLQ